MKNNRKPLSLLFSRFGLSRRALPVALMAVALALWCALPALAAGAIDFPDRAADLRLGA